MRPKMLEVFPHLKDVKIDYQWGGMIGIGAVCLSGQVVC